MPKNYYIILGIPLHSSQKDIKAAFRRLAKEHHPDHSGNRPTPFQAIHEAYSVLSDPVKRRNYDSHLQDCQGATQQARVAGGNRSPLNQPPEPLTPEQSKGDSLVRSLDRSTRVYSLLFDGLFDRLLAGFEEDRHPRFARTNTVEVQLTREQALQGGNVRLKVPMQIRCPNCNCFGHSGQTGCWRCNGSGYLTGEKQLLIHYPAGVKSGHTIKLPVTRVDDRPIHLSAIVRIHPKS